MILDHRVLSAIFLALGRGVTVLDLSHNVIALPTALIL